MEQTRNFVIISHIDHGKSTLADRLLEMTGAIDERAMREQFLDSHPLERERGITIKMSPARMRYEAADGQRYTLNLIDTPGHADFGYEVSRALAAVEGAVLLVDATAGVQAQTVSNALQAVEQDLAIIPVINKIDLPHADPEGVADEIRNLLGIDQEPLLISAKTGAGVDVLLDAVVERVPPPQGDAAASLRALVFDSMYDPYQGIQAFVRVVDGSLEQGAPLAFVGTGAKAEAGALFTLTPEQQTVTELPTGSIGLVATGIKEPDAVMVGDTLQERGTASAPLPGYRPPQPVVFASFFPEDQDAFEDMRTALHRLRLNDAALEVSPTSAAGLGRGFRCGFLGLLHLEVIQQRLERDEELHVIVTPPSVVVRVTTDDGTTEEVASPTDLPPVEHIAEIEEPWVRAEIVVPNDYIGDVMRLLDTVRGEHGDSTTLGPQKSLLRFVMPAAELIQGFYDDLKRMTSGFASLSYEEDGFRPADLVRLDVLVNKEMVPTLSTFVAEERARAEARRLASLLKELIPAQLIAVPIQVAIGVRRGGSGWTTGDIIARETKKALRKDVTGDLYGGDVTRKKKLLEKQKKGKKKMKERGGADIPADVYIELLRRD